MIVTPKKTFYERHDAFDVMPALDIVGHHCITVSGTEKQNSRTFIVEIANYIATAHHRYHRRMNEIKVSQFPIIEIVLESSNTGWVLPNGKVADVMVGLIRAWRHGLVDIEGYLKFHLGCYFDTIFVVNCN